ncbi:histidine phosphatase family protein [Ketobacter sp.]|uniref:histidine phosphatase family protein n=1 Tax=Ketobacter sp. TaxID=2083498 RepID=UPI000F1972CF|nr:histidine phosphatase family protein [Ketobacter sp.]RLT92500.1 MAG: histidine phosphatase family protein [Ketobacter sp.]
MTTLYLVRHGEAAASWEENPDPGLSERGLLQAQSLPAQFDGLPVQHIVSSPLCRARETAIPLSQALGIPIQVSTAFREIPSPVDISLAERLAWLRSCAQQPWEGAPAELQQWRQNILDALRQLPPDSVVFTHFMVMNAVLGHTQERPSLVCYQPDYGSVLTLEVTDAIVVTCIGKQAQSRVL